MVRPSVQGISPWWTLSSHLPMTFDYMGTDPHLSILNFEQMIIRKVRRQPATFPSASSSGAIFSRLAQAARLTADMHPLRFATQFAGFALTRLPAIVGIIDWSCYPMWLVRLIVQGFEETPEKQQVSYDVFRLSVYQTGPSIFFPAMQKPHQIGSRKLWPTPNSKWQTGSVQTSIP